MANYKSQAGCHSFNCINCNYITDNKKDYNKHLLTAKHIRLTNTNETPDKGVYTCICGKTYKHASSLCKHRKECIKASSDTPEHNSSNSHLKPEEMMAMMFEFMRDKSQDKPQDKSDQTQLIIELVKQNTEFKELLIEQNKQMVELAKNAGNNNNNTNSNNKFNLNVFLNETCKDAITMDDFIKSIEVTRDEFIHTGKVGFIEGISAAMLNNFRNMELHTRPLHCTDLKRETIYIKNSDKWEKEDANKTHLRKAVKVVANKNMKELWKWYNDSKPEVEQIGSDACENYFQYYKSALGGCGKDEDIKFEDKIIKNVLKEVVLDKTPALVL